MRPSIALVAALMNGEPAVGAEVGVENGVHAFEMLEQLPLKKMYLVDAYKPHYDKTAGEVEQWQENAKELLSEFKDKIKWLINDSVQAAPSVANESLDFVYIDADHAEGPAYNDIKAWTPKVRSGGIVAGHDFATYEEVRKAVIRYAQENDIEVCFRQDDWWFAKP